MNIRSPGMSAPAPEHKIRDLYLHLSEHTLNQAQQRVKSCQTAMARSLPMETKQKLNLMITKMPQVTVFRGEEIDKLFSSLV